MKTLYKNIKIPALKGKKLIPDSKLFSYIDSDFKNYGAKKKQPATKAMLLEVKEIDKDGTFRDIFGDNPPTLTHEQILWFVENHKDKLRGDGWATLFPFKSGDELFVAYVRLGGGGFLGVSADRFSYGGVWDAEDRHRVVVPQVTLNSSDSEPLASSPSDTLNFDLRLSALESKLEKIGMTFLNWCLRFVIGFSLAYFLFTIFS